MSLNASQRQAVEITEGRVLVLAGAGSGKTKVITHRIAHLIEKKKVAPSAILGLTFTNKAAAEMRERLETLIGPEQSKQVTLATFHSFCMQVLRKDIARLGYTTQFTLYDERDMDRLIQQLVREMLGCEGELPSLGPTKQKLAEAAYKGVPSEELTWHDAFTKTLYEKLLATMRAHNALNFDHLIQLTLRLFEEHPDVLSRYQERYRYLMIDEYQDTNPAQFRLAELLAARYQNLCVVGDDDQSIYAFRGASISNILHFRADHTIRLEQNYRSTPTILEAANQVIEKNKGRHPKKLWSEGARGEPIEVFTALTEGEEANGVVKRLLQAKEQGMKWRDMAILYRSNALSRSLEMALLGASYKKEGEWVRGIPYEVFGGLEFGERSEIKDIVAFLRVLTNPLDQEALLRILNVPRRGIGEEFLDLLTQKNRAENIPLWNLLEAVENGSLPFPHHPRAIQGVKQFLSLMNTAKKRFEKESLAETLVWFLEEVRYKKAIEEEVKSEKMKAFKWENVQECVNSLAAYEQETSGEDKTLSGFLSQTALGKQPFSHHLKTAKEDKVQLMTLHSAKGLEFPLCFLVGLEDHILPHEKSAMETGIEEERRLFYVGITRARKRLVLSMAASRMRMGKPTPTNPSRFLFEIPKQLLLPTRP